MRRIMPEKVEKRFRAEFKGFTVTTWNPDTGKEETFLNVDPIVWGNSKEEGIVLLEGIMAKALEAMQAFGQEKAKGKGPKGTLDG